MIRKCGQRALVATVGALVLTIGAGSGIAVAQDNGINVSGSSTVEPITALVGELFAEENPDVPVAVDGPGTGDGFALFCDGETDISNASRPIEEAEIATCESNGIEYTELPVGLDGLSVVVNKKSSLKLKCLSQADLYAIFGPESTGDLADASALATELGSTHTLPSSGSVTKFTPGPESGTYDAFIELGYEDIMGERLEAGNITDTIVNDEGETQVAQALISDGQFPNDNDIVQRVASTKDGIGFLGIAYYLQNKDKLKAVAIEDPESGSCVKPTVKTVQSGTYLPLSRTLSIYVNNTKASKNRALKDFVDFYMMEEILTDIVTEAGYAPLHDDEIQASIEAWSSAR